jgi:hypothetical protein
MRTILAASVLSLLLAARAYGEESPKMKVAILRLDYIAGRGELHEKIFLLSSEKATRNAMKEVRAEIRRTMNKIVDAGDESELNELGRRLSLLNRKIQLIQQSAMQDQRFNNAQSMIHRFVIDHYKDKYSLILQDPSGLDRAIWKGAVEIRDITEEVADQFQKHLNKLVDE